jgi:predicted nucleic acid-binding protein
MIILDTNVLSEPLRPHGDPAVTAWLDRQRIDTLYLTTITIAELLLGVENLPLGLRRSRLAARIDDIIHDFAAARVLSFDMPAARRFATLMAHARGHGQSIAVADGQIAAIAACHGFAVATRDGAPFVAAGLPVIDPWTAS